MSNVFSLGVRPVHRLFEVNVSYIVLRFQLKKIHMILLTVLVGIVVIKPHPSLPTGWSPTGLKMTTLSYSDSYTLDDTGRYIYSQDCHQWDFKTGSQRSFVIQIQTPPPSISEHWRINLKLVRGERPGQECFFKYARGETISGSLNRQWGTEFRGSTFAATINGPATNVTDQDGLTSLAEAGCDFLISGSEANDRREHPPLFVQQSTVKFSKTLSTRPGESLIVHGHQIKRLKLPGELVTFWAIPGGVRWTQKKLYLLAYGPFAYQVDYSGSKLGIRPIASPPIEAHPLGFLSNGSICCQFRRGTDNASTERYSVAIFDTNTWKWTTYPGMIVFATSKNGRYVAYGWQYEPGARIARVTGNE